MAVDSLSRQISQRGLKVGALTIEINGGLSRPIAPFNDGVNTAERSSEFKFNYFEIGSQVILSDYISFKADFSHDNIETFSKEDSCNNDYYRVSARSVFNFGRILHFEALSLRACLLVSGGAAICALTTQRYDNNDFDHHIVFGITPYYEICDNIALNFDLDFSLEQIFT